MNIKNFKKIIAREGLILLACIGFIMLSYATCLIIIHGTIHEGVATGLWIIAISTYPAYLIIKFIIWAIKTLREKE